MVLFMYDYMAADVINLLSPPHGLFFLKAASDLLQAPSHRQNIQSVCLYRQQYFLIPRTKVVSSTLNICNSVKNKNKLIETQEKI